MNEVVKETLSIQAFIVKRSFILNSIASETGYSLEMVQSVQRRQSLKYSVIENKTFKVKTLINTQVNLQLNNVTIRNTLFTSIHFEECLFLTVLPLKLFTFWKWYC